MLTRLLVTFTKLLHVDSPSKLSCILWWKRLRRRQRCDIQTHPELGSAWQSKTLAHLCPLLPKFIPGSFRSIKQLEGPLLDELALVNTHSIRNPACLFICPHIKATFISIRYDISLFKEKQWNVQTMLHFLLTEFKVCTVSYGLSFSAWIYKMRLCKSQQGPWKQS